MLSLENNALFIGDPLTDLGNDLEAELAYCSKHFCGRVIRDPTFLAGLPTHMTVYLCGDVSRAVLAALGKHTVLAIEKISGMAGSVTSVSLGRVPINIAGIGVFFREFFEPGRDYYNEVCAQHEFQALKLSNKPDEAFRRGIYLTPVTQEGEGELKYRLLRCSTNLAGSTDNFRSTDCEIVEQVNGVREKFFPKSAVLNHVLAQTYHNKEIEGKEKKARIARHSDKTKDMPELGLLTFCSFYDASQKWEATKSGFDYIYGKGNTVLTKLRFRLKETAEKNDENDAEKMVDVTLYPNSLFIMSLHANRQYTHEIMPSSLPVHTMPTRMGYVIRCSDTVAYHREGNTYVVRKSDGAQIKLEPPTTKGIAELKECYKLENATSKIVQYQDRFFFSMNEGDYRAPIL